MKPVPYTGQGSLDMMCGWLIDFTPFSSLITQGHITAISQRGQRLSNHPYFMKHRYNACECQFSHKTIHKNERKHEVVVLKEFKPYA